jgi:hypothetical protein
LTKYVACLYCLNDKKCNVFLGKAPGIATGDAISLMTNPRFLDLLSKIQEKAIQLNKNIFTYEEGKAKTALKFRITREKPVEEYEDILVPMMWIGNRPPECRIIKWELFTPGCENKSKRMVTPERECIILSLSIECMMFPNIDITVAVMNKYLQVCTQEQHASLLESRYVMYDILLGKPSSNPSCFVYNMTTQALNDFYIGALKECPEEYILCEMVLDKRGHFTHIPKRIVQDRGTLTNEDIIEID